MLGTSGMTHNQFAMWCLTKIPSQDVIKFAHFDIHWKKKILIYLMTLVQSITLTLSETVL